MLHYAFNQSPFVGHLGLFGFFLHFSAVRDSSVNVANSLIPLDKLLEHLKLRGDNIGIFLKVLDLYDK